MSCTRHDGGQGASARLGWKAGLAVWVLPVVLLAACEYPGIPHPQAATVQVARNPGPAAPPKPARPADGAASASANVLQGKVPIGLKDFKLDPEQATVKAGAITFALKNEGRYTHDFRVEGDGLDEKAPKVGSGRTIEWRLTLKPGAYRVSCPVSNHADRGMTGTLTVVP